MTCGPLHPQSLAPDEVCPSARPCTVAQRKGASPHPRNPTACDVAKLFDTSQRAARADNEVGRAYANYDGRCIRTDATSAGAVGHTEKADFWPGQRDCRPRTATPGLFQSSADGMCALIALGEENRARALAWRYGASAATSQSASTMP